MKRIEKPQSMTIEFDCEELQALAEVCARIGGSREGAVRKHTDKLADILREGGYVFTESGGYYGSLDFDQRSES